MTNAIELRNVKKRFGRKQVLNGLSMTVPEGAVYALLGCNGAGKSTTVKLITGQLANDGGSIRILGLDPLRNDVELRRQTGYVAENQRLFNDMRLDQFCVLLRKFYPDWNPELCSELIDRFHLPETGKLGTFSRGMYSKAALLGALCRTPRLLVLDDPTLGLDTPARREFMDGILETLQEFRHTVLITSHLIPELEGLCDHAGIIRDGKMVLEGEIDCFRSEFYSVRVPSEFRETLPGELKRQSSPPETEIFCRGSREECGAILQTRGIPAELHTLSLEEIFLLLTSHETDARSGNIKKMS